MMNPREEAKGGNNDEDDGGSITLLIEEHHDLLLGGPDPKLMKKSAGGEECCIFRIPQRLENNNEKAYEPRVVSFGPYHHGKEHLQLIQEHKYRLLGIFLDEAKKKGVGLKDLLEAVSKLEEDIRESYSESFTNEDAFGRKLIYMMLVDGCFILMLFLVVARKVWYSEITNDPIFKMPWILPAIRSDLLLLENQVPFFLLQTIYDTSKIETSSGLNEIIFSFFSYSIKKPNGFWLKHQELEAKHLLDLIRKTFMPTLPNKREEKPCGPHRPFLCVIQSARKILLRGIEFKPRDNAETLLDIRHKKNLLMIPPLVLDDFLISFFLNCVAYEKFYAYSTKHMTTYVAFMGCLLKDEADAMLLKERGITEHSFGPEDEVYQFLKVVGKDISFDLDKSYLADVFEGVNEYTARGSHVYWAGFKHTHLNYKSPWTFLSACTGLTVLLLTFYQTFFAAYSYFRPPNSK